MAAQEEDSEEQLELGKMSSFTQRRLQSLLEMIMSGALKEHEGNVRIDNRTITNLHFRDDKFFLKNCGE